MTAVIKLCDKSENARHVTIDDALAEAIKNRETDDFSKGFRKCIIIFDDHESKPDSIEWFCAGASKLERFGIIERFKNNLFS